MDAAAPAGSESPPEDARGLLERPAGDSGVRIMPQVRQSWLAAVRLQDEVIAAVAGEVDRRRCRANPRRLPPDAFVPPVVGQAGVVPHDRRGRLLDVGTEKDR